MNDKGVEIGESANQRGERLCPLVVACRERGKAKLERQTRQSGSHALGRKEQVRYEIDFGCIFGLEVKSSEVRRSVEEHFEGIGVETSMPVAQAELQRRKVCEDSARDVTLEQDW